MTESRRMMDTTEAAAYAKLGKSTLDKLRVLGGGPHFLKIGRRVIYDIADIDDWLSSHRRRSTSETGTGRA